MPPSRWEPLRLEGACPWLLSAVCADHPHTTSVSCLALPLHPPAHSSSCGLPAQLSAKAAELASTRREKSETVLDLQQQLSAACEARETAEAANASLKTRLDEALTRLAQAQDRLRAAKELAITTEEQFRRELAAKDKLATLYKKAGEATKSKSDELASAFSELQKLYNETAATVRTTPLLLV